MEPTNTKPDQSLSSTKLSSSGRFANKKLLVYIAAFAVIGGAILIYKSFAAGLPYKEISFSSDPQWEAVNTTPGGVACVNRNSDFGYGVVTAGTVGGTISGSSAYREYYAKDLGGTKNLGDSLTASGQLSIDRANKAPFLLGWFNKTVSQGYYPRAFLGLEYDGTNFNLVLSTKDNMLQKLSIAVPKTKTVGKSPLAKYATYTYSLAYNPSSSNRGQLTLRIGNTTVTKETPAEIGADTASFSNFGLLNVMTDKPAPTGAVYIDNLSLNGVNTQFDADPHWDAANNKLVNANDCEVHGRNNYGWFNTNNAGGAAGEIGGLSWHNGAASHYADTTEKLSLANRFYATGKIDLKNATQDGKAYFGWFGAQGVNGADASLKNVLGVQIAGSPAAGYRLLPMYRDNSGGGQTSDAASAPKIPNGTQTSWTFCYEPNVNAASAGRLTFSAKDLGKLTLDLPNTTKSRTSGFDRFGMFVPSGNTNYMNYYLDDLRYTVANADSGPSDDCGPVDTAAPTVSFTAPTAASYASGANYMVKANVNDNLGVVGVQFKLDGQNLGAEDITSPYEVSWDTTKAKAGVHKLTAIARDAVGNRTTVDINTTVDNTKPTVSLTKPTANQEVSGNAIALSATAADAVKLAGVQFKLDNVNLGAEDTAAPFDLTWDSNTVVDGPHKLTATARDAAGNTTTTAELSFVVHNDKTAPTVSITAPANGSFIKGTSLDVSADAADNKAVAGVQFLLDDKNFQSEDTASPYGLSLNLNSITEDQHTVSAVARDGWGNKTTATKVSFTVDNTAPTVRIYRPGNTARVHGVFYVSAAADDENGVVGVQFYLDGHKIRVEDRSGPFQIKWDSRTVGNGRHTFVAIARDAAGNTTTSNRVKLTVRN